MCSHKSCGAKFSDIVSQLTHEKLHKKKQDELFKCDKCPKTFQHKSTFGYSWHYSSDKRPLACSKCGRKYKKKYEKIVMNNSVKFHMNSHVNTNSVTLHMQTQNCTMSIYVQNIARARKVSLSVHIAQKHLNTTMVDRFTSKSINLF